MRTKATLISLLLFAFAAITFAAAAQDEPVTLRFTQWIPADSPRGQLFADIASQYSALHPNVTVEFDFIPFADYVTTLPLRLSGSNPPDAGWLVENVAPTWVSSGILADMGPALRDDAEYDLADLSVSGMELWSEADAIYGVPFSTSPFLLIYNRDLFEAAGASTPAELIANGDYTWDSLAASLATVTQESGVAGLQSVLGALYTGERVWHTLIPIIRAYGGDAWDDSNTCQMNSPESVAGIQKFHDMIFVDGSVEQPDQAINFAAGEAAAQIGQLSGVAQLADATFAWDIAALPAGPAGQADVIGQAAFVVFRNSPNPDVAIDFVKFLTNQENTLRISQYFPPIRASVLATDVLLTANPSVAAESMQNAVISPNMTGRVLPAHANFATIDLTSRPFFDMLWTPDADVQDTMDQLCDAIQPLLSQ